MRSISGVKTLAPGGKTVAEGGIVCAVFVPGRQHKTDYVARIGFGEDSGHISSRPRKNYFADRGPPGWRPPGGFAATGVVPPLIRSPVFCVNRSLSKRN
jgi:hypothetical protein